MSRSRKKMAGSTWACCKSQKKGKQLCHRINIRRNSATLITKANLDVRFLGF